MTVHLYVALHGVFVAWKHVIHSAKGKTRTSFFSSSLTLLFVLTFCFFHLCFSECFHFDFFYLEYVYRVTTARFTTDKKKMRQSTIKLITNHESLLSENIPGGMGEK